LCTASRPFGSRTARPSRSCRRAPPHPTCSFPWSRRCRSTGPLPTARGRPRTASRMLGLRSSPWHFQPHRHCTLRYPARPRRSLAHTWCSSRSG
jgi:hypothetical protein